MQIIITFIVMIGIMYVISLIRRGRLELKYALSWIAVAVMVLILDWIPGILKFLANILGIASPMNMLFFMGFVLFFTSWLAWLHGYSSQRAV